MSELRRQRIAVTIGERLAFKSWSDDPQAAGFTMAFSINRTNKAEPSKGTITITNPPEAEALALVQARKPPLVRVFFGWDTTGLALVGGGNAEKDGVKLTYAAAESNLEIGFIDGIAALRGSYVAVKVAAGAKASDVVRAVIEKSGLPPGIVDIDPADDYILPRAYTAEGGLSVVLGRLAKTLRADASIQDGKIQFLAQKRLLPGEGPLFSTENGRLIGKPEPRGRDGAVFKVVACPELLPGGRFRVRYAGVFGDGVWKAENNKTTAGSYQAGVSVIEARMVR